MRRILRIQNGVDRHRPWRISLAAVAHCTSSPSSFGQAGSTTSNNNNNSFSSTTTTTKMTYTSSRPQTNANASSASSSSISALPPNIRNSFGISQTELDDLRHAFQLFDTENKGKILLKDVRAVLESIRFQETSTGSNNTNADSSRSTGSASSGGGLLDRVLARIRSLADNDSADDTNMQQQQQQLLSMPDFIALMTQPDPKNDQRSEMRKVFDLFDVDRKGHINANDLGRIAAELGEVMDRQELQEMIQRASSSSTSSSGKVYPQDFEAIMSRRLFS